MRGRGVESDKVTFLVGKFFKKDTFLREYFIMIKIFVDIIFELMYSKCTGEYLGIEVLR